MTKYEVNLKSKDFYVYCVASFFSIFTSQMGPVSSAPLAASLQMTWGGPNVIHEIWHANSNFQKDRQNNTLEILVFSEWSYFEACQRTLTHLILYSYTDEYKQYIHSLFLNQNVFLLFIYTKTLYIFLKRVLGQNQFI